jgi:hypothetical protein
VIKQLPRGPDEPVDETFEITHGEVELFVQQLIVVHPTHVAGGGGIVVHFQPVGPEV